MNALVENCHLPVNCSDSDKKFFQLDNMDYVHRQDDFYADFHLFSSCQPGFEGDRCEMKKTEPLSCDNYCENDATCTLVNLFV